MTNRKANPLTAIAVVAIGLSALILGGCSDGSSASSGHWYDFGNGMINLDNVHHISGEAYFSILGERKRFSLTEVGAQNAVAALKAASEVASQLNVNALIRFDNFELGLQTVTVDTSSEAEILGAFHSWMSNLEEVKKLASGR